MAETNQDILLSDQELASEQLVRQWLQAKPQKLAKIVDEAINNRNTQEFQQSREQVLHGIEQRYQDLLQSESQKIDLAYQSLSQAQKVDLLIYADEVDQINRNIRENAKKTLAKIDALKSAAADQELTPTSKVETPAQYPAPVKSLANESNSPRQLVPKQSNFLATPESAIAMPNLSERLLSQLQPITVQGILDTAILNSKQQASSSVKTEKAAPGEKGLDGTGSITVNYPIKDIPLIGELLAKKIAPTILGKSSLTPILSAKADLAWNEDGSANISFKYAGVGAGSGSPNLQWTPVNLNIMSKAEPQTGWGGDLSALVKPAVGRTSSDMSGRVVSKTSIKFGTNSEGETFVRASEAPTLAVQNSRAKAISTATFGYYTKREGLEFNVPATMAQFVAWMHDNISDEQYALVSDTVNRMHPAAQVYSEIGRLDDSIGVPKRNLITSFYHRYIEDGHVEYAKAEDDLAKRKQSVYERVFTLASPEHQKEAKKLAQVMALLPIEEQERRLAKMEIANAKQILEALPRTPVLLSDATDEQRITMLRSRIKRVFPTTGEQAVDVDRFVDGVSKLPWDKQEQYVSKLEHAYAERVLAVAAVSEQSIHNNMVDTNPTAAELSH